eukprot:COSAG01_NODE_1029_length_12019_cov_560.144631_10_plen_89_part_00
MHGASIARINELSWLAVRRRAVQVGCGGCGVGLVLGGLAAVLGLLEQQQHGSGTERAARVLRAGELVIAPLQRIWRTMVTHGAAGGTG